MKRVIIFDDNWFALIAGLISVCGAFASAGCTTDVSSSAPFAGEIGHEQVILRDCVLIKTQTFLPAGEVQDGPRDVLSLREARPSSDRARGFFSRVPAGSHVRILSVHKLTGDGWSEYQARMELIAYPIRTELPIVYIWGLDNEVHRAPWEPL